MDSREVLARRAEALARSGAYEGFNALNGALVAEFGEKAVEILRRDVDARQQLNDLCRQAWEQKHA